MTFAQLAPWIATIVTFFVAVVGWMRSDKHSALVKTYRNGLSEVVEHRKKIADLSEGQRQAEADAALKFSELRSALASLADGQKRLETGQDNMRGELKEHLDKLHPRGRRVK